MSFGGQSGAPWQRNNMMQPYAGGPGPQHMYMQQQQQNNMGGGFAPMQGMVSYPQQPRSNNLNPMAFQSSMDGNIVGAHQQQELPQQQHHQHGIGTVTKINDECGLINDEIFFYRNACKGTAPKLGDRVIFEATISTSGQFKWNAHLVQMLPSHTPQPLMSKTSPGYALTPSSHDYRSSHSSRHGSPRRASPIRDRHLRLERERRERERNIRPLERDDDEVDRKRRREDRSRDRERERDRSAITRSERAPVARERERYDSKRSSVDHKERERFADRDRERERERERERSEREREREKGVTEHSPVRAVGRRLRMVKRYMVKIPKTLLLNAHTNASDLQNRYHNLYIPSDFFDAHVLWPQIYSPENSFSLSRPCQFHIKNKMVDAPHEDNSLLEPADADYLYSAKVMLLASPPLSKLYSNCIEGADAEIETPALHLKTQLSFLVGTRGQWPMAIGGPWSPSLDGENPDKDPSVLIRTAIRTCKALTGIDLSNCTQWVRFLELSYHRTEYKHKEKNAGPRVETVVIYLPDVHSCMPSADDYQKLAEDYKAQAEAIISRKSAAAKSQVAATSATAATTTADNTNTANDSDKNAEEQPAKNSVATNKTTVVKSENKQTVAAAIAATKETQAAAAVGANANDNAVKPTHYSQLDVKTIKLETLRKELLTRNLPCKGPRSGLLTRLTKALEEEEAAEKKVKVEMKTEVVEIDEDESNSKMETDTEAKVKKEEDEEEEVAETNGKDTNEVSNEELDAWANVVDVDMNDIVILDEYDSRKNPEETPKEMDEKEKNLLICRYTLPMTPHIVVLPNKHAKGGKFYCSLKSLSELLEYNVADTKERHFEVALFAELFNEMLIRDFGFNIYKELYLWKDNRKPASEEKDEAVATAKQEDAADEKSAAEDAKSDDKVAKPAAETNAEQNNEKTKNEKDAEGGTAATAESHKRKSTAGNSNGKDEKTRAKDAVEKKMVVVKPHLLLSFVYFDVTNYGCIYDTDLEDLIAILGLNLSRGQIRKMLNKFESRRSFYYRKLTDKEEVPGDEPAIEDVNDLTAEELKKIAAGNMLFIKTENNQLVQAAKATENSDLINYNGTVVHVGKLIEQIKRTDLDYSNLDKLYTDVRKQYADLQRENNRGNNKIKDLQSEVKSLTRKLTDVDADLFSLNRKYKDQQSTLSFIYNRVAPYFSREKDKHRDKDADKDKVKADKEKDKDKTESSRNKDRKDHKDNKDKEKEQSKDDKKDKEKEQSKDDKKDKETEVSKDDEQQEQQEQEPMDTEESNDASADNEKTPETEENAVVAKDTAAAEPVATEPIAAKPAAAEPIAAKPSPAKSAAAKPSPAKSAANTTPTKAAKKAMPANSPAKAAVAAKDKK